MLPMPMLPIPIGNQARVVSRKVRYVRKGKLRALCELRARQFDIGLGYWIFSHCRPRIASDGEKQKSIAFGKFPDIFGADIDLVRPHKSPVPDANHAEEIAVVQLLPIWLVEIAGAVEDSPLASVELNIDLVTVERSRRNYVMQRFHFSATDRF